jgi:hypothetical protein
VPPTTTSNALQASAEVRITTKGGAPSSWRQSNPQDLIVRRPGDAVQIAPPVLAPPVAHGRGQHGTDLILAGGEPTAACGSVSRPGRAARRGRDIALHHRRCRRCPVKGNASRAGRPAGAPRGPGYAQRARHRGHPGQPLRVRAHRGGGGGVDHRAARPLRPGSRHRPEPAASCWPSACSPSGSPSRCWRSLAINALTARFQRSTRSAVPRASPSRCRSGRVAHGRRLPEGLHLARRTTSAASPRPAPPGGSRSAASCSGPRHRATPSARWSRSPPPRAVRRS